MSDDETDPELLTLLRSSLGLGTDSPVDASPDTGVLGSALHIYNNSIDVAISMAGTRAAAALLYRQMQQRNYSTAAWRAHELHPKSNDAATADFIFTTDLLNFCFWSERGAAERFAVEYRGRRWTGYWSLVACLQCALDDVDVWGADIPITTPSFWRNEADCPDSLLHHVFRSATAEEMPLLRERIACLREASIVLSQSFASSVAVLIASASHSAAALVNVLAASFPCFNDVHRFEGREVRILKRAQIFVADLWAAFDGEGYGRFGDIDSITMFADYRVPQMLHYLGVLSYSPPLASHIRSLKPIPSGHAWEIQLRGNAIQAVELLKRQIHSAHPDAKINAILIDFFLYDAAKERERELERKRQFGGEGGEGGEEMPHHRTRSIWY
ncbi:hypothetical protein B0A49_02382 [Cryomyces minteri]|uniref:Queuosine 5'-phosphate N-glycosylase/hydrolase n=1 Tax=Cryomyces minteri TaxID=331657 RepID=A0A4U0XG94_9PEZI|nr:hypothetical protein B0A49_02382 [Cryomyces minteri]